MIRFRKIVTITIAILALLGMAACGKSGSGGGPTEVPSRW